jgi:tetratricopeptide (TPR) repeat protein
MEEAENLADFAERLCSKVCLEPTIPLLQFLAFYFAFEIGEWGLLDKLVLAEKVPDLAEPLLLSIQNRRGQMVSWDEMKPSLSRALEVAPNDWIASLLYLSWKEYADLLYPESDVDVRPIETIERSINENEEFEYFRILLNSIKMSIFYREGNHKEANHAVTEAIAIARKFDDLNAVVELLRSKANIVKYIDLRKSLDLLLTSRNLSKQLGSSNSGIAQELGHIMTFRGELDAAVDYHLECCAVRESKGYPISGMPALVALSYNMMGDGMRALECANDAIAQVGIYRPSIILHSQKAWALINLGRTDEARDELEKSKRLAIKSGGIDNMLISQMVEGILDKAENDSESAVHIFEEVLKARERDILNWWEVTCLLNLVDIEIEMLSPKLIDINTDSSGPWMQRLEEYVRETDVPGIAARSLLLKAKLRRKQGRHDEVRRLLKEVLKAAESPSMRYLKDIVVSTFPDVIVS